MHIIVCIKQVPDTQDVRIDAETNTLIREGTPSIVNPFCMYAVEEGLRIKERFGGRVTVISMGPPQAEDAIRETISMGVDEGILVSDRAFAGSDTLATSYTLASSIRKIGDYNLIICGRQAMDGDTGQVGPELAEVLGIPQITYVRKIEEIRADFARAERMTEWGYQVIETSLPALFTVVKEINIPRLPSLRGKLRARKTEIPAWNAKDMDIDLDRVGLKGSPTRVMKIFTPEPKKAGQVFKGKPDEAVVKLLNFLKEQKMA